MFYHEMNVLLNLDCRCDLFPMLIGFGLLFYFLRHRVMPKMSRLLTALQSVLAQR